MAAAILDLYGFQTLYSIFVLATLSLNLFYFLKIIFFSEKNNQTSIEILFSP